MQTKNHISVSYNANQTNSCNLLNKYLQMLHRLFKDNSGSFKGSHNDSLIFLWRDFTISVSINHIKIAYNIIMSESFVNTEDSVCFFHERFLSSVSSMKPLLSAVESIKDSSDLINLISSKNFNLAASS